MILQAWKNTDMTTRTLMAACAAVVILIAILFVVPACAGGKVDLSQAKVQLEQSAATLAQAEAKANQDAADAVARGDTKAAEKARKTAEHAKKMREGAEQASAAMVIDPATGEVDLEATAGSAVTKAGALLPPPYNLIALIGAPIVVGMAQEWRRKRAADAAKSIVKSVDEWIKADPMVMQSAKNMPDSVKAAVHAPLTKDAVKLIDTVSTT